MSNRPNKSELVLAVGFLAIIFAVPVVQTCIQLYRKERVQFTDVFRAKPTARNLRQFDNTLEEKSWFEQKLRPQVQRLLFAALRDPGAKAILGRDGWLCYRPDVRYLVEPDRLEVDRSNAKWVRPPDGSRRRESVLRAIVRFRDQLKERGIELLVVPAPGKPSVYPEQLTRRAAGKELDFQSPTLELLKQLETQGVATVDLFAAFQDSRRQATPRGAAGASDGSPEAQRHTKPPALYLAQDTHWTPLGARLAARTVAARLKSLGWAPPATKQFQVASIKVKRWGDILEMMQIPRLRDQFGAEVVECEQIRDPALGLLVPTPSDRPGTYRYPGQQSSILVLGDSFCRVYQYAEPQSLGELLADKGAAVGGHSSPGAPDPSSAAGAPGDQDAASTQLSPTAKAPAQATRGGQPDQRAAKRLLPGSAGFISRLALELGAPVDAIVSDGGASTDVRRKLSTNPELLEGKKVVIWEFVERDIALGREGWEAVPLPRRLDQ
jgi:hypothetical protein